MKGKGHSSRVHLTLNTFATTTSKPKMHFTRLLGICLLPMASFAVPVTLSLSVLLDDASMAEFGHHHSGMKAFGRGNHERIASGKTISPEEYLGYLSDYWGNLTEADKALKDLKVPDQKDDDDTWDEYTRRYDVSYVHTTLLEEDH